MADRLKRLVQAGLLTRAEEPGYKQKARYSLTEPAIGLVPLLAQMGAWGRRHTPSSPALSIRAQLLEEGGPALWENLMAELRTLHLGLPAAGPSVIAALRAAYEAERARAAGAAAADAGPGVSADAVAPPAGIAAANTSGRSARRR